MLVTSLSRSSIVWNNSFLKLFESLHKESILGTSRLCRGQLRNNEKVRTFKSDTVTVMFQKRNKSSLS